MERVRPKDRTLAVNGAQTLGTIGVGSVVDIYTKGGRNTMFQRKLRYSGATIIGIEEVQRGNPTVRVAVSVSTSYGSLREYVSLGGGTAAIFSREPLP